MRAPLLGPDTTLAGARARGPAYLFFGSDNEANCWTDTIEPGSWNGALDELRVYDYALTAEQVASDMRAL